MSTNARWIEAQYPGRCFCGWEWDAGDQILWERGEGAFCEGRGRQEEELERKRQREARERGGK